MIFFSLSLQHTHSLFSTTLYNTIAAYIKALLNPKANTNQKAHEYIELLVVSNPLTTENEPRREKKMWSHTTITNDEINIEYTIHNSKERKGMENMT